MILKKSDLVLEVGSGNRPNPRSDVLVDKFVTDSGQREAGYNIVIDRPFVIADAQKLPFKDKSFDYIIASHLVEHLENPALFFKECMRVADRGYIECPTDLIERMFSYSFHLWYVYCKKGVLTLIKKTAKSKKNYAQIYHLENNEIHAIWLGLEDKVAFSWERSFKYRIVEKESEEFLKKLDRGLKSILLKSQNQNKGGIALLSVKCMFLSIPYMSNMVLKLKKIYGDYLNIIKSNLFSPMRKQIDIYSIIVCPACHGKLIKKTGGLTCLDCRQKYILYKNKYPDLVA